MYYHSAYLICNVHHRNAGLDESQAGIKICYLVKLCLTHV